MAKHNVYLDLPSHEVSKVDLTLDVHKDGKKFGTITISKGSIEWYPYKAKKPLSLSWTEFDKMFNAYFK